MSTPMGQVMDRGAPTVCLENSPYSAIEKMLEHGIAVVPVMASEPDWWIIGVVHRGNIIRSLVLRGGIET